MPVTLKYEKFSFSNSQAKLNPAKDTLNLAKANIGDLRNIVTKDNQAALGISGCTRSKLTKAEGGEDEMRGCIVPALFNVGLLEDSPDLQAYLISLPAAGAPAPPRSPVRRPPSPVAGPSRVSREVRKVSRQPVSKKPTVAELTAALQDLVQDAGVRAVGDPISLSGLVAGEIQQLRASAAEGRGMCGAQPNSPRCDDDQVCDLRSNLCLPAEKAEELNQSMKTYEIAVTSDGRRILGSISALDQLGLRSSRRTAVRPSDVKKSSSGVRCRVAETQEENITMELLVENMASEKPSIRQLNQLKNAGICLSADVLRAILTNRTTATKSQKIAGVKREVRIPLLIMMGALKFGINYQDPTLGPIYAGIARDAGNEDIVEFFASKGIYPMEAADTDDESDVELDDESDVDLDDEPEEPEEVKLPEPTEEDPQEQEQEEAKLPEPTEEELEAEQEEQAAILESVQDPAAAAAAIEAQLAMHLPDTEKVIEQAAAVAEMAPREERPEEIREVVEIAPSPESPEQLLTGEIQLAQAISPEDMKQFNKYRECLGLPGSV